MERNLDKNTKIILEKYRQKFGENPYMPTRGHIQWDEVAKKAQKAIETNKQLTDEERENFEELPQPGTIW